MKLWILRIDKQNISGIPVIKIYQLRARDNTKEGNNLVTEKVLI